MNYSEKKVTQTVLAAAIAATLGTAAITEQASANILNFNISGWLTVISPDGAQALINLDASGAPYYGARTPVSGTMTFDTDTNSGSLTIQPFSFFGSGSASATNISFYDTDGPSGADTLMLGNMSINWAGNIGIPVSIVWNGEGVLDAINQGLTVGDTIGSTNSDFACDSNLNCATPATNDFPFMLGPGQTFILPIGASPIATTTWNTTDIGIVELGTNPSGTLPLIDDAIGGSPIKAGPFTGFNANLDFDSMVVTGQTVQFVDIDIKPDSDTNSINLSASGVVPVAILGTEDFDALTVDPTTVSLAGASVKMVGNCQKH